MNNVGLYLTLITFGIILVFFLLHPFIKKVTNSYWFWLPIGIGIFLYMVICRYQYSFADFWKNVNTTDSLVISRGLMLDLCPLSMFIIPIALIVDPTRKIACSFAFLGMFGALSTFPGFIMSINEGSGISASWDPKWIFLGEEPNRMYFMTHFLELILTCTLLLNSRRRWKIDWPVSFIIFILYSAYVITIAYTLNVKHNANGYVSYDWSSDGEYGNIGALLKVPFPWQPIICFSLATLSVGVITMLYQLLQKSIYYHCVVKERTHLKNFI